MKSIKIIGNIYYFGDNHHNINFIAEILHDHRTRQKNIKHTPTPWTKSLEEIGVIKGYAALLDAEKAGFDVMAFVQVSINQNTEAAFDSFKTAVRASPHILECYSLSGPYDHLMKVVARSNKELSHFILKTLKTFPEIRDAQTLFVLHQVKHTTALPVELL
mgnify:CR=1 FL=1